MSWEDLENNQDVNEANKKAHEEALTLAKNFNRCFTTPEGTVVIEHLTRRFLVENDTPLHSNNINYEAAYHNGEAGLVRYLLNQITKAEDRG